MSSPIDCSCRWRLSLSEIRREVITQGLVAEIGGATLWRWLSADALRPWRHRSWIFPRDPDFATKAGRILDLYARVWQGRPLNSREFVISADEKSSIQARRRKQPTLAPAPGRCTRVEHEYFRGGRARGTLKAPSRAYGNCTTYANGVEIHWAFPYRPGR